MVADLNQAEKTAPRFRPPSPRPRAPANNTKRAMGPAIQVSHAQAIRTRRDHKTPRAFVLPDSVCPPAAHACIRALSNAQQKPPHVPLEVPRWPQQYHLTLPSGVRRG
jgi:hypothetical protein